MSESGHVGTTSRLQLLFLPIQHKLTSFLSSLALMDPSDIAKQFTTFYYHTFDTDRLQLAPLYRQGSMLTFERAQILGVTDIVEKLTSLPFAKVRHNVSTIDVQPSISPGALIVSVTGHLLVDDEPNPLSFSQVFQLVNDGNTYYVHNDIFRLNVG
ncbi:nuclear transport factor 2 [Tylopilus felleus]